MRTASRPPMRRPSRNEEGDEPGLVLRDLPSAGPPYRRAAVATLRRWRRCLGPHVIILDVETDAAESRSSGRI
jgi:hypothetical protein